MLTEGSGSDGCRAGGQLRCGTSQSFSAISFDNVQWRGELLSYPDSVPFLFFKLRQCSIVL